MAEHIAISETSILQVVTDDVMRAPKLSQRLNTVSDGALLTWLLDRTSKFQAPEMLKPNESMGKPRRSDDRFSRRTRPDDGVCEGNE